MFGVSTGVTASRFVRLDVLDFNVRPDTVIRSSASASALAIGIESIDLKWHLLITEMSHEGIPHLHVLDPQLGHLFVQGFQWILDIHLLGFLRWPPRKL